MTKKLEVKTAAITGGTEGLGSLLQSFCQRGCLRLYHGPMPLTCDLREPSRPVFYIPFDEIDNKSAPTAFGFATFVLHADSQNSLTLANSLRQLIAQRNNGLRVSNITTQLDLFRDLTIRERLLTMLAAFLAAVALLLAGIGLYAVLFPTEMARDAKPMLDV